MKEYILNETPLRTSEHFNINDIKVKLDIPSDYDFHDFIISNNDHVSISYDNSFSSKIGLDFDKCVDINIVVPSGFNDDIFIKYLFSNNDVLINNINIKLEKGSNCNIILRYESIDDGVHFNSVKLNVNSLRNSNGNITILNLLNSKSYNFCSIEHNGLEYSNVLCNYISLGGCVNISNLYGELYNNSKYYFNNIYIGDNNLIDMNYHVRNIGIKSVSNIEVQGLLSNNARKNFKGTIDFIEGSSESIGKENENCVLLDDSSISRSLPMLLCHEENVEGAHSVSSGKIDDDKLFYLMTKGYSREDALELLIISNFNSILNNILDADLRSELICIIEDKIKKSC